MYSRVLVTLIAVLFAGASFGQSILNSGDPVLIYNPLATYGTATNPADSALNDNLIKKWIYSPTQKYGHDRLAAGWDRSRFKCYKVNNMNFRLRFPNNYDSTNASKYPVIVFWHGGGEVGVMHENQDQLFWGAQTFEQYINAGEWNGFLLFIQEKNVGFDLSHFTNVNIILDSMNRSCAADPDRVIHMGLSEGGFGGAYYAYNFPQRTAAVVVSNAIDVGNLVSTDNTPANHNNMLNKYVQIPFWIANGGVDGGPQAYESINYMYNFGMAGGNFYQTYYPTQGHGSWSTQWGEKDFFNKHIVSAYWNNSNKSQPIVYYNNTKFCTGQTINAKMGVTAGFSNYQWQMDNGSGSWVSVGGNTSDYTATQVGKYRVHFQHADGTWSVWSPNPIVITANACSLDTVFAEHFDERPLFYNASIHYVDLLSGNTCGGTSPTNINQNGIFTTGTEVFTQDASGRQGGRFMLNATAVNSCVYAANEEVWRTYQNVPVTPNTNYTFSFYLGNQSVAFNNASPTPLAKIIPRINGVTLVSNGVSAIGTGNTSWQKFSFNWNSGSATSADLALLNATTNPSGNDFAIDEISLTLAKAPIAPGGVVSNLQLWSRASTIPGTDNSPVSLWQNDDINSPSLAQLNPTFQPVLNNNATNNINFNPVANFNNIAQQSLNVGGGFSGTASHTAVHAYVVMNTPTLLQNTDIITEAQSAGNISVRMGTPGNIIWYSGTSSFIVANSVNEANKPILWSLSSDNLNGTGSGFKKDIRKNGNVVASSATGNNFTGSSSATNFDLGGGAGGGYNGNIAEVVYYLDANINAGTQNKIESYLALKYGTTLGFKATPQNYRASDSSIFWNANGGYQSDVFGIGTDSTSGLVQTKSNSVNSGSGDGTGQSGKGNLVLATNTSLKDKQFLMIGNDSTALTQRPITNLEAPFILQGAIRLTRTWKVNNTGAVGPVDLSFDSTGLGELSGGAILSNYALLIDSDGDANYNTGTASVYYATSAAGKRIIFSGVTLPNNVTFTILTVRSPNSTLPATWLGFNVVAKNDNAQLTWQTSEEINVDHYSVEHSLTGGSYVAVGAKAANNSTGINTYTFTHGPLSAGIHYYRIRRVDKDGVSEFSVVKTVNITSTGAIMEVRPNPVVGSNLQLAISTQQNAKAEIHIMTVDGKTILQQSSNLQQGMNTINMNVANVPSGIYLVQMVLNGELVTKKFIRQR